MVVYEKHHLTPDNSYQIQQKIHMDNDILNLQAGKYCTFTFIYMQELCVKDTTLCIILFFHYGSKLALNHVPKRHEQVTCENVNCHVKTDMRRTY